MESLIGTVVIFKSKNFILVCLSKLANDNFVIEENLFGNLLFIFVSIIELKVFPLPQMIAKVYCFVLLSVLRSIELAK